MLRNNKDLRGYAIRATDGVIGEVDDFYFDDEDWAVRNLIVDTGSWLSGRKVLISPLAVGHPDWLGQLLPLSLTKTQVERARTSTPRNLYHVSRNARISATTPTRDARNEIEAVVARRFEGSLASRKPRVESSDGWRQ
jgi:hypothetical protein